MLVTSRTNLQCDFSVLCQRRGKPQPPHSLSMDYDGPPWRMSNRCSMMWRSSFTRAYTGAEISFRWVTRLCVTCTDTDCAKIWKGLSSSIDPISESVKLATYDTGVFAIVVFHNLLPVVIGLQCPYTQGHESVTYLIHGQVLYISPNHKWAIFRKKWMYRPTADKTCLTVLTLLLSQSRLFPYCGDIANLPLKTHHHIGGELRHFPNIQSIWICMRILMSFKQPLHLFFRIICGWCPWSGSSPERSLIGIVH